MFDTVVAVAQVKLWVFRACGGGSDFSMKFTVYESLKLQYIICNVHYLLLVFASLP